MKRKNMTVSKKTTRRALGMNILSLLLCVSMLIGTTFAWFTDSVTSGRNQIIAGNLDVEVYHGKTETPATKVTSETADLFTAADGSAIKWEPGVVVYDNFTVKNEGDMAMEYKFALRQWDYNTVTVDGKAYDLRDVVKVVTIESAFVPTGVAETDRATAKANGTATKFEDYSFTGTLKAAESKTFAVVMYWDPSDVDNIYNINNGKTVSKIDPNGQNRLFLTVGIDLVATQLEYESDSFDQNYDKDAELPGLNVHAEAVGAATLTGDTELTASGTNSVSATVATSGASAFTAKVEGKEDAVALIATGEGTSTSSILNLKVESTGATESSMSFDISMKADVTTKNTEGGTETSNTNSYNVKELSALTTATINIGKALNDVTVKHSGTVMQKLTALTDTITNEVLGGFYYNKETGDLTIKTRGFSPYEVTFTAPEAKIGDTAYATLADAVAAAANNAIIVVLKDCTSGAIAIPADKTLTINGNGKKVTLTEKALFNNAYLDELTLDGIGKNANLTVNNLTMVSNINQFAIITATDPRDQGAATIVFDGCTFKDMYSAFYGGSMKSGDSVNLTIKNSKFENCTYAVSFEKAAGWTVSFDNNTMTGENAIQELFASTSVYLSEPLVSVTNGTYSKDPSAYVADGKKAVKSETEALWTIETDPSVAKIVGGVGYETLQAAIDAATEGQTVKLLQDVKDSNGIKITTNKNIAINLNGKTVECTDKYSATLLVDEDASLSMIYGGTLKGAKPVYINGTNAYLGEIKDCELVATNTYYSNDAIYLNGKCDKITNVEISGKCEVPVDIVHKHSGTTIIEGLVCEVGCYENWLFINNGDVEIKSATVKEGNFETSGTANITVYGGTFSVNPSTYVPSGYEAKPNGTSPETWTVAATGE